MERKSLIFKLLVWNYCKKGRSRGSWHNTILYVINHRNWCFCAPFLNQRSKRDAALAIRKAAPELSAMWASKVIQFRFLNAKRAGEIWIAKNWITWFGFGILFCRHSSSSEANQRNFHRNFHQKFSFAFFNFIGEMKYFHFSLISPPSTGWVSKFQCFNSVSLNVQNDFFRAKQKTLSV